MNVRVFNDTGRKRLCELYIKFRNRDSLLSGDKMPVAEWNELAQLIDQALASCQDLEVFVVASTAKPAGKPN